MRPLLELVQTGIAQAARLGVVRGPPEALARRATRVQIAKTKQKDTQMPRMLKRHKPLQVGKSALPYGPGALPAARCAPASMCRGAVRSSWRSSTPSARPSPRMLTASSVRRPKPGRSRWLRRCGSANGWIRRSSQMPSIGRTSHPVAAGVTPAARAATAAIEGRRRPLRRPRHTFISCPRRRPGPVKRSTGRC